MLMSLLLLAAISFGSCSKDDHKSDEEPNYIKLLSGVWESDDHSGSIDHFFKLNEDGTGEELLVTYSGSSVSYFTLDEITWKADATSINITKGKDIKYHYYTLNEVKDHMVWEWKGTTESYSRVSGTRYDNVMKELPIDKDVVGCWASPSNTETAVTYRRFYKDGTCIHYEVDYNTKLFDIKGYNWSVKGNDFKFFNSLHSSTYKYKLEDDNPALYFGTSKWNRVSDNDFKASFPNLVLHLKGGWKDQAGWKKVSTGIYKCIYLYFYDDGTFRTIDLRSTQPDGSYIYSHYSRLGYYKFEESKFTYSIDNGVSKGSTLYSLSANDLTLYTNNDFFSSGETAKLKRVDDSEVTPYLE